MATEPAPAPEPAAADSHSRAWSPPSAAPAAKPEGGVKETIESILVAFILAFIFRAFVVEAFVIPTGSMAPTLLGAHMRFTCTDCGYRFDVNYSAAAPRSGGSDVNIPRYASGSSFIIHCPSCGFRVPESLAGDRENDATAPPVHFGDRILVLKYIYELFPPQRWDVVVFKTPHSEPPDPPYTINYIKRLVGRPNETVMILDGDIYVKPRGGDSFTVQTKPRMVQNDLWRIVHDHDFIPLREAWVQPWRPEKPANGWDVGTPEVRRRQFEFANADGAGWIAFKPDPATARTNQPLTDWLAYAVTREGGELRAENAVSDLKIACSYYRESGSGPLMLELSKLDDTFTASIYPDRIVITHLPANDPQARRQYEVPVPAGIPNPGRVEFQNVDYQVTLRINGVDYFQSTREQYNPNFESLRATFTDPDSRPPGRARIGAEAQTCRLSHLSLWRDIYYVSYVGSGIRPGLRPQYGTPGNPVELLDDEYFVLGDNSVMSGDARYWGRKINLPDEALVADEARVPGRFLLGKAFFIYWPAGYRPFSIAPGVVPNFGSMRFIH